MVNDRGLKKMVYDRLKSLWASGMREYCCWVIIVEWSFREMWTGG